MPSERDAAPTLLWFRQDLRLDDHLALREAAARGPVLGLYVLDDVNAGERATGAASRAWLHRSLRALNGQLGGRLVARKGDARRIVPEVARAAGCARVYWSRCYEPWRIARDRALKAELGALGIEARSFNASLLYEPWEIAKPDGEPYRVFTPFWRKGRPAAGEPGPPMEAPAEVDWLAIDQPGGIEDLGLWPRPRWAERTLSDWIPGEAGANARLDAFAARDLERYAGERDQPAQTATSRLSPHLHFGEISPRRAWAVSEGFEKFRAELGWREFSYSLAYQFPGLASEPLQEKFARFPWRCDERALEAWKRGRTGVPMVDAGMRELWATGWMHNRARMIAASFLVKNLMIDWREGEAWFWDTLFDADHANNAASWQWVAGCGADAAPYFRVFNPVLQGKKFDPHALYVHRWIPELRGLSPERAHEPWKAPDRGGYPLPIVDLAESRARALAAFEAL